MSYLKVIPACWSMVMLSGSVTLKDGEDQAKKDAKIARESSQDGALSFIMTFVWT